MPAGQPRTGAMSQLFHFNVVCSDFDRSYDFYTRVLGMSALTSSSAGTRAASSGQDAAGDCSDSRRPGEGRAAAGESAVVARILGMEGSGDYRGCFLYWGGKRDGPYIDLLQWADNLPVVVRSPQNVGLARVAIRVDDLDAELARLAAHEVPLVSEPQELVLGVTKVRVVCFRDPDGVLLEYLEFVQKTPWGQ